MSRTRLRLRLLENRHHLHLPRASLLVLLDVVCVEEDHCDCDVVSIVTHQIGGQRQHFRHLQQEIRDQRARSQKQARDFERNENLENVFFFFGSPQKQFELVCWRGQQLGLPLVFLAKGKTTCTSFSSTTKMLDVEVNFAVQETARWAIAGVMSTGNSAQAERAQEGEHLNKSFSRTLFLRGSP